ncbi:hypothetical protein K9M48_00485 [Candidatus Gracilibacteria bacterium]|nr:hypothetical protein [Candidatus Gracilibacteria bacterium]
MAKQNKVMKLIIIITFAVFILSTLLMGALQFFDMQEKIDTTQTGENLTGVSIETGINLSGDILDSTGTELTGESN